MLVSIDHTEEKDIADCFSVVTKLRRVRLNQFIAYPRAHSITGMSFSTLSKHCFYVVPYNGVALFHPDQIVAIAKNQNITILKRACRELRELQQRFQVKMKSLEKASDE